MNRSDDLAHPQPRNVELRRSCRVYGGYSVWRVYIGRMRVLWRAHEGCIEGIWSGDTTPCRMTGVTLHGVVSPDK